MLIMKVKMKNSSFSDLVATHTCQTGILLLSYIPAPLGTDFKIALALPVTLIPLTSRISEFPYFLGLLYATDIKNKSVFPSFLRIITV